MKFRQREISFQTKHSSNLWEKIAKKKNQQRYNSAQKWEQTDLDFTTNCVFLNESAFPINLKRDIARSKKDNPTIITVPTAKANKTSKLGAISATGLINVSLRENSGV
ncbi:hypothetical protein PHYBLDRAFT_65136 [Phycomyces blakesleeanus NRRL 1555(-)]|uniref:Homeodomain-like DNA binding domain-containing transcription factor n=1 Tax=Phycomyces blakesleeanus (strain ATCC 8743b / DSM 1359 / FGSC 10004 / NBRC 33097 / NRRL 1555) TaxID=763407 RepID=A0A167MIK5_PHYB8|nr:hypothetical protein PHYBLDRAFT_65136 [Phycomyces blakesleeanus NRRL 1555(-)]OAD72936.1 hypothetical protein PHYBLDRAFT_65136 [Phycomyces blakesleeanus NRRL 1555(-)]|eukprot:XP_018290976.1 hypothetical protein PHYBLDRAFT_65136 [Phycomyces blakesleeanus NRRL 1555(-)]